MSGTPAHTFLLFMIAVSCTMGLLILWGKVLLLKVFSVGLQCLEAVAVLQKFPFEHRCIFVPLIIPLYGVCIYEYSRTSHNGPSEKRTTSLQQTNTVLLIEITNT